MTPRHRKMTLEEAIALAATAHKGQCDKGGQPYILHPLRVMQTVDGDHARMAAVLHDVVEDTKVTLAQLRSRGCPRPVVTAVDALTRRRGESYIEFVLRSAKHPIARIVKLADLRDNLDPRRLGRFAREEQQRLVKKYRDALAYLVESAVERTGIRPAAGTRTPARRRAQQARRSESRRAR
jgi:guanosine-3',5'-bis(diphosphate) 3'-pyrophosphohydrolase